MNRRTFLRLGAGTGWWLAARPVLGRQAGAEPGSAVDRQPAVRRHNPDFRSFDPYGALSLGNGEFAFTADITGLQTFADVCEKDFPLCTMAHWAWHAVPRPPGTEDATLRLTPFETYGRPVGYMTSSRGQAPLFNWLRENPHGLHLGRIALDFDGTPVPVQPADLTGCRQQLDLWTGQLDSRFEYAGAPVRVRTCVHPELDAVAVRVESPLVASGRLRVRIAFPYGSPSFASADWTRPERHETREVQSTARRVRLARRLDDTEYRVESRPG